MVKKTTVAPASRFLGVRLPLAMFDELRRAGEKEGKLVSEYVRDRINRVSELEKRIKQLQEDRLVLREVEIGKCCICGKPLLWDLTDAGHRQIIAELLQDHQHQTCR